MNVVSFSRNTFGSWMDNVFSKTNRQIHRIGYLRAASALNRIGYTKEAMRCIEAAKSL